MSSVILGWVVLMPSLAARGEGEEPKPPTPKEQYEA